MKEMLAVTYRQSECLFALSACCKSDMEIYVHVLDKDKIYRSAACTHMYFCTVKQQVACLALSSSLSGVQVYNVADAASHGKQAFVAGPHSGHGVS